MLFQWLALIPPAMVEETLGLSADDLKYFSKTKPVVVGPANSTAANSAA